MHTTIALTVAVKTKQFLAKLHIKIDRNRHCLHDQKIIERLSSAKGSYPSRPT